MTSEPGDVVVLARSYIEVGRYEHARSVLGTALTTNPQDPRLLAEYARAEVLLHDYVAAANAAYAALAGAPEFAFAMRMYATALDGLGRLGDAMTMSWRAVVADPEDYLCHYDYASRLHTALRLEDARIVVLHALRLAPGDSDCHALHGKILQSMGRLTESDAAYQEALRLDPSNAAVMNNLAVNKLRRGGLSGAMLGFLGAASLDPGIGDLVRRNVGVVVTHSLRRMTFVATVLGLPVMLEAISKSDGHSTGVLRVISAVVTVLLAVMVVLLIRVLPRTSWWSILRGRPFLVVRCAHVLLGLLAGIVATVFAGPLTVIMVCGPILILGGGVINFVGRLADT